MKQFVLALSLLFLVPAFVYAGTIDTTNKYARFLNDGSLINFGSTNGGVVVNDGTLTGYAWSANFGWINLAPTSGGVTNNGNGVLTGYAWGQNTGWINFKPTNGGVTIDSSGNFNGYAWSETKGWIVFNCATDSSCGTLSHKVQTNWIPINARPQCNNTLDDDSDGKIDYPADGGCISTSDTDEAGPYGAGLPPPPAPTPPATPPTPPSPPAPPVPPSPVNPPINNFPPVENPFVSPPPPSPPPAPAPNQETPSGNSQNIISVIGSGVAEFFKNTQSVVVGVGTVMRENVREIVRVSKKAISQARRDVKVALDTPVGDVTSKTVTTVGVVTGGATSALTLFFTQALSLKDLFLLPAQLWGLLLSTFGIKRRHRPWGAVYDSVTKQPLDPAYIELQTLDGKDVATAFTDLDGRYGFFAPAGVYRVVAQKTNYKFPSEILAGKTSDEFYRNLYFGETISLGEGETFLARDIPMDAIGFDWNEYAKKTQNLMGFYSRNSILIERLSRILFTVGFLITLGVIIVDPQIYNISIGALYVVVFLLRKIGAGDRPHGVVIQKETGLPLAYGAVKVLHPGSTMVVKNSITDALGRYYCLVTKGSYQVQVMRKESDGTYSDTAFSKPVDASSGIIQEKFEV